MNNDAILTGINTAYILAALVAIGFLLALINSKLSQNHPRKSPKR